MSKEEQDLKNMQRYMLERETRLALEDDVRRNKIAKNKQSMAYYLNDQMHQRVEQE
eukprot:CAMPEP_0116888780 /NCGR_PEP_ID=MMETSP0463-20121206/23969_1 /TAXON_ID=181622 /ORGANISM="Strombidinopsis sp, Strain SopsisLIS2011" /LENGTH=55 /DNA_ID=CAMNT_0004554221 /DNA_START=1290 /DNA_END=1457 /DNA_ORIENTATION=+